MEERIHNLEHSNVEMIQVEEEKNSDFSKVKKLNIYQTPLEKTDIK